jgi:CHAT domain-containing protein
MTKLRKLLINISVAFLFFSLMLLAIFGLGRLFHLFPPVKALVQIIRLSKIGQEDVDNSIEYCIEVDNLADIYYEKDFKKRGTKNRKKALKCFVEGNFQQTNEYATSLYKYTQHLSEVKDDQYQSTALHCRDVLLMLYQKNQLDDNSKTNLVEIIFPTLEFETELDKRIKLIKIGMEINNSIGGEAESVMRRRIMLFAMMGFYCSDDYKLWIEAQNNFEEALKFSRSKQYTIENTLTKIFFSRLLIKMQNYERAKLLLFTCNKEVLNQSNFRIIYKKQFADIFQGLGLFEEAQNERKAIEILNYEKDPVLQFLTFSYKGQNAIARGNLIRSYYYVLRIQWLLKKPEINDNQHLVVFYYLKLLYSLRFNNSEADEWRDRIKKIKIVDNQNIMGLLIAEVQLERLTKTDKYYNKAYELFLIVYDNVSARFKYLTENERVNFWSTYESIIKMLYESAYYSKPSIETAKSCYNAALFSKGILLGSSIEFAKLLTESSDKNLLLQYYQLLDLKQQIVTKVSLHQNIDSLSQLSEKVERELVRKSHEFGDYTNKMHIKWEDVQHNMQSNDIAIEFIDFPVGEDSIIYSAIILRKDWAQPKMITLFEEKQLLPFINTPPKKDYSIIKDHKIFTLIWGRLLPLIDSNDNVYFAPTNLLHKIAVEYLPINDSIRINQKFKMNRVSSTKQLCFRQEHETMDSSVLYGGLKYSLDNNTLIRESRKYPQKERGVNYISEKGSSWDDLAKTKNEVDTINNLLKNNKIVTLLYTGSVGNEESFKNLSGRDYSIIHIATHGFFYTLDKTSKKEYFNFGNNQSLIKNPLLRSGLILAGANTAWSGKLLPNGVEDGILTAQDVATLNLRKTNIVVLSACETGLGEITSEGVFGLQRAFKKAGVQTLVMSLWNVDDDATAIFMISFYKHLLSGSSKQMALLKAQQTIRSIDKYKSPFYWSAFIMLD